MRRFYMKIAISVSASNPMRTINKIKLILIIFITYSLNIFALLNSQQNNLLKLSNNSIISFKMNNQLIQEIFKNKINFYIFKLKDLNETEREILVENLKSKIIIKNPMYERMMHNEITKIEQMKEEEKDYNKYITIIIQCLINENNYTSDDIKKIIEQVKTIVSMIEEDNDIEMKEDTNIRMNNFIYKLNLGENDNTIKYVKQLTTSDYLELTELLYISDQEDIVELLNIIIEPFIKYKYQKSEKYISDDLLLKFLTRFNTDKFAKNKEVVKEKILQYLMNDNSISLDFLLINNDISHIYSYLNIFKKSNNVKFIQFCQKLKKHNKQIQINNRPKNFCDFSQHKEYINISGLKSKKDTELVELLYIVGRQQLKLFLKELNYGKYYNELQKINIITYQKLENLVLNNKIIKKCRSNKKILPGKVLKNIIFTILNKNNKLELMKKIQEKNNDVEMEILEMKFEKLCVNPIDKNENIKELKQQKINMENLILLLKENNEDVNEIEKELKQIKNKIKKSMLDCDTREELLNENINELTFYLENNLNLDVNDKNNIKGMMKKYQMELNIIPEKKYGNNFIQNVPIQKVYNQFDQRLTNLINKFEQEDQQQQKEDKKKKYYELQNEIITNDLKFLISKLDKLHNENLFAKYEMISDFLKYKIKDIIPFIYKNLDIHENKYQKNNMVYKKLRTIIHVLLIILICTNKNLKYDKIYDTKSNITNINKKVQKVIIKCNGKEADLIDRVGDCYFVNYLDSIIELKEDEIEIVNDLKGKTCKIIKGNNKGLLGVIYEQKNDYVLLTKDLYGKNNGHHIPGLSILKIPIDHIKIIEEIENEKMIVENKELYDIFNKKSKDLYSLVKFEVNKNYNMNFLKDFDLIYKYSIELFNNYKISETEKFSYVKTLKQNYLKVKKEIKDNKNNKRVYIKLNKELKKLHHQIRESEKSTKFIKDSLFNNSRNLNNNYIFNKNDDGIYQLKEYQITYSKKQVLTKEQKKVNKKLKIQKEKDDIKRTVENYKKDVKNMLNNLLD